MSDSEFKNEMLTLAELLNKYNAANLLSIMNDLRFPIVPELQNWIVKNIVPKFNEAKLKKQAIVVHSYLISQMSMEQTIDDVEKSKSRASIQIF